MDEFLQIAYDEAVTGRKAGGIPIGSVLVRDGIVLGRGHNQRVQKGDPIGIVVFISECGAVRVILILVV